MKIKSESEILDKNIRKQIIDEIINGNENTERRLTELRKQEIYRDQNKKWLMHQLSHEGFDDTTLFQIQNRASNISICRKITNKLAQSYTGGATRTVEDAVSQESVNLLEEELDVNTKMKKSDRYRQLFRNTMIYPVPILSSRESTEGKPKFDIGLRIMAPWQYDVVEDPHDLTKPMVVILSDFQEQQNHLEHGHDLQAGSDGRRTSHERHHVDHTNRRDDKIADNRADKGIDEKEREFIWWSDSFHFTTDQNGELIPQPGDEAGKVDTANAISKLPFINVAGDQDGFFWAIGGTDVVEGSVLLNKILTDINFVTFIQGWGQLVIAGKNLPKKIVGGPNRAFKFDMDSEDDPTPAVFYASSNPPIGDWLETVRSLLAMLLSTNDLSPRSISMKLEGSDFPSGIALIIEQSEVIADIQDVQNLYQDKEPEMWEVIRLWHEAFHKTDSLVKNLQEIPPFKSADVKVKFHQIKPPISEKEHLENIKQRKELGLNLMVELLQKDNPDLSDEDAKKKIEEILKEKTERQQKMMGDIMGKTTSNLPPGDDSKPDENEENKPEENKPEDEDK